MAERKMAPHVARAIGAAQAKPAPATGPGHRLAPHVAAAVRPSAAAPAAQPFRPPQPATAPHVAAAVARPGHAMAAGPLQKKAPVLPAIARHVAAAIAPPAPASRPAAPPAVAPAAPTGRLAGLSAHLAAAQAKMTFSPRPNALHVPAACGVVQPSRDLAKEKKNISKTVDKVNNKIVKIDKSHQNYFVGHVTSLQNQKVAIKHLPKSKKKLKLTREQTRISGFAYSIREKYKFTPEVQIGLLLDTNTNHRSFSISTNKKSFNTKLAGKLGTGGTSIRRFYRKRLRQFHVERRGMQLHRAVRTLKVGEINAVLKKAYQIEPNDEDAFLEQVDKLLAREAHIKTKLDEMRLRQKAARALAISSKRKLRMRATKNTGSIHSESSILGEKKKTQDLIMVVGTKVPCLACRAFFQGKNVSQAVLSHSSFAWLSLASLKQLGFEKGDIEGYLDHLYEVLGKVPDLYQHGDKDGELTEDNFTWGDDDTDSEDEDAMKGFVVREVVKPTKKDESIFKRIDDFVSNNF